MSPPKVLISDKMSPRAEEIFKSRGVDVTAKTDMTPDVLKQVIGEYDGLAIRSATKVTNDILSAAGRLKVIGRAGIGVDNIDIPSATQAGIVVMNTPFGNSITTAEHTLALLFSLARDIPQANASTHAGKWEKSKFMGQEIFSKTLGVIGCGNIGSIVADRALGLKMKVIAYDPYLTDERAVELGVEKVDLDELLQRADFITLHTPMTDGTRGILNKDSLSKTKQGVRIINCARGGLVVEADLKDALDSGHVAGAALDDYESEPATENALFNHPKVICTPHLGASTTEAQENVALQVAEQISDYLLKGAVMNAINMPSVSAEDAPKLKPYMVLAEQLGQMLGQMTQDDVSEIRINYEGHVADLNIKPLTALILAGFLRSSLEGVNIVSAPARAKDRGIDISETRRETSPDFQTLIRVSVKSKKAENSVAGTLFGGQHPRLVEIDGVAIETEITPNMLLILNHDQPGMIGNIGSILGNAHVNIAGFRLGRIPGKDKAIALISVDEGVGQDAIKDILALPHIEQALALRF